MKEPTPKKEAKAKKEPAPKKEMAAPTKAKMDSAPLPAAVPTVKALLKKGDDKEGPDHKKAPTKAASEATALLLAAVPAVKALLKICDDEQSTNVNETIESIIPRRTLHTILENETKISDERQRSSDTATSF
jgi:hypothetical protein